MQTFDKCCRGACQSPLSDRYRIWNNHGQDPPYREYCIPCGRKIIEYNKSMEEEYRLKFEIIDAEARTEVCTCRMDGNHGVDSQGCMVHSVAKLLAKRSGLNDHTNMGDNVK